MRTIHKAPQAAIYDGALKALITNFFLSFIPQSGVLRQPNVTHTRTSKNPTKPKIIQILV